MLKRYTFALMAWMLVAQANAQHIPTPKEHFGFNIGDDYMLANYTESESYFRKLAAASDRVRMELAGKTSEGRNLHLIIISSPENLAKIDDYKAISQKLARAEIPENEARELVAAGKPVVWIDGGLHATETVATQQLIETFYQLVSRDDAETLRILDDVVILLFHCNPDGHELVSNWYMRNDDVTKRAKNIPVMYHKYAGHDNNRDFYMNNLAESTTISRLQYIEWMPQIIYNHHQSGPPGSIVAGPPYRDPFNFVLDPMLITGIDGVAAAMINRLNAEGKPGYTRLSGSVFSTWWNGGLRTTPYYHNSIGILTEVVGDPTPMNIPLVPDRLVPNNATPYPITPRPWHFREAIDYSVSMNYAVLDYASRFGDELLYNMYRMGRNSIERGSQDYWPLKPSYIDSVKAIAAADVDANGSGSSRTKFAKKHYDAVFQNTELRDPRGFIIPANQPDFPRAVHFINALVKSGIQIHQAMADFSVNGKAYPAGSYIVKTAQAFRPHVIDMFEPQDHPNDFQYPGGPPVRPYDAAGWTLAHQFGIEFDRITDEFNGPFQALPYGELQTPPSHHFAKSPAGYLLDARVNNAYITVNNLLAAGIKVARITEPVDDLPAGSFYVPANGFAQLQRAADTLGIKPHALAKKPKAARAVAPARIALFDRYGGSMPSGWVRWLLEQYQFDNVTVIYPQDINAGKLNDRFDIILFIGSGIPAVSSSGGSGGPKPEDIPEQYHHMLGSITRKTSIPKLKEFLEAGGKVFTVGSSTALAYHLELPVKNALVELDSTGRERPLPGEKFYAPGSIHQLSANTADPAGWGMPAVVDVVSSNSPVFQLTDGAASAGITKLAWYGAENPLRSGWIWGAAYLKNGVAAFSAPVGRGTLYAFGPEITFRAQPHGTFRWLFNQLYTQK
ncbi:Zinc carboxypeptidase [Parapedobacter composti]|uniref:Zinc carboxypeptidase n=1 Tax=Parapedobacter composti TaxID=623281 RepID=A0A1I1JQX8_9SPHI|nr:M14 metallopeptidase family protein [Parapedobacter composti]SFC51039.1 Zinc carboxypeptidase [Parapedobacter composti]